MGWTDSHLHQFEKDGLFLGVPESDEFDELDLIDESKTQLAKLLKAQGDSLIYLYDFGDSWRHEVVLEGIIPMNEAAKTPLCLDGARRCPPEDVGGVHGYQEFLQVVFDPAHEEYEHLVGWAGGHFHDSLMWNRSTRHCGGCGGPFDIGDKTGFTPNDQRQNFAFHTIRESLFPLKPHRSIA